MRFEEFESYTKDEDSILNNIFSDVGSGYVQGTKCLDLILRYNLESEKSIILSTDPKSIIPSDNYRILLLSGKGLVRNSIEFKHD